MEGTYLCGLEKEKQILKKCKSFMPPKLLPLEYYVYPRSNFL